MEMSIGYKIVTFLFDGIFAPRNAFKLEWYVPHGESPLHGERKLTRYGVKVWSRLWETDGEGHIETASVLIAPGQRQWAEEIMFVASPRYEPACETLDRTDRRIATNKPYKLKGQWSNKPVKSKTLISGLMGILDRLG